MSPVSCTDGWNIPWHVYLFSISVLDIPFVSGFFFQDSLVLYGDMKHFLILHCEKKSYQTAILLNLKS